MSRRALLAIDVGSAFDRLGWGVVFLLLACHPASESTRPKVDADSAGVVPDSAVVVPDAPRAPSIVVFWTVDTLGAIAAEETGFCGAVGAVAARHGLDTACLDRAVSTASWTGESHTRQLWPENGAGAGIHRGAPECGHRSVLAQIAQANRATYLVGLDNPFFENLAVADDCGDGRTSWTQDADQAWTLDDDVDVEALPEADRPVHHAIDALLEVTGAGGNAVVFLNTYESGGHKPRCWFEPTQPACQQLYQLALDAGAATPEDDPAEAWRTYRVLTTIVAESQRVWAEDPGTLRGLWWETITTQIAWFRPTYVDDRLERLLAGLAEQGRLDDLVLVMVGDHGENTGVPNVLTGEIQMFHSDLPTEYTAEVPFLTIPAALGDELRADGLASDGTLVWSAPNAASGLLRHFDLGVPTDWPAPEPIGSASSWECLAEPGGVRIDADGSVRCDTTGCGAWSWQLPALLTDDPTPLAGVPEALLPWTDPDGEAPWFQGACRGTN